MPSRPLRSGIRIAFPPSGGAEIKGRAAQLESYLSEALGQSTQVTVPETYELLARELLTSSVDAAWAPPFVCARVEAMGVRVLVRGIRRGASTFRAAVLVKASSTVELTTLAGTAAMWTDRDSVGGCLLALAYLKSRGIEPNKIFRTQGFAGTYRKALESVLSGEADVTSVFAPPSRGDGPAETGLAELWPEQQHQFRVLAFTEEAPNDGVAVAMSTAPDLAASLEKVLLGLHETTAGASLLKECFHAERFEPAPRLGFRALYRVALASL